MVVVNSQIKLKAEKILTVLDKKRREEVKKYVRPEEKPREIDFVTDVREEIKPVQLEESLSDIDNKSIATDYDSDSSDMSESSCFSFIIHSHKFYYNRLFNIIDIDEDGFGFNCGKLLVSNDMNKYDIILNNVKYIAQFNSK